jgi:myosin heavy subunit
VDIKHYAGYVSYKINKDFLEKNKNVRNFLVDTTMETSELSLINTHLFPVTDSKQSQKQTILQLFRVWTHVIAIVLVIVFGKSCFWIVSHC